MDGEEGILEGPTTAARVRAGVPDARAPLAGTRTTMKLGVSPRPPTQHEKGTTDRPGAARGISAVLAVAVIRESVCIRPRRSLRPAISFLNNHFGGLGRAQVEDHVDSLTGPPSAIPSFRKFLSRFCAVFEEKFVRADIAARRPSINPHDPATGISSRSGLKQIIQTRIGAPQPRETFRFDPVSLRAHARRYGPIRQKEQIDEKVHAPFATAQPAVCGSSRINKPLARLRVSNKSPPRCFRGVFLVDCHWERSLSGRDNHHALPLPVLFLGPFQNALPGYVEIPRNRSGTFATVEARPDRLPINGLAICWQWVFLK